MSDFDSLPDVLRQWAAQAVLPWSAASLRRVWRQALRETHGCETRALGLMSSREAERLRQDIPSVWGNRYPADLVGISRAAIR